MRTVERNPEAVADALAVPGHIAERMFVGSLDTKEVFSLLNQPSEVPETSLQQEAAIDYLYTYPHQAGEVLTVVKKAVGGVVREVFDRQALGWYTSLHLVMPGNVYHKSATVRADRRREGYYQASLALLSQLYRVKPPEGGLPHPYAKKRVTKYVEEKLPGATAETIVYRAMRDKTSRNPLYVGTASVEIEGERALSFAMGERTPLLAERAAAEDLHLLLDPLSANRIAKRRREIILLSAQELKWTKRGGGQKLRKR